MPLGPNFLGSSLTLSAFWPKPSAAEELFGPSAISDSNVHDVFDHDDPGSWYLMGNCSIAHVFFSRKKIGCSEQRQYSERFERLKGKNEKGAGTSTTQCMVVHVLSFPLSCRVWTTKCLTAWSCSNSYPLVNEHNYAKSPFFMENSPFLWSLFNRNLLT